MDEPALWTGLGVAVAAGLGHFVRKSRASHAEDQTPIPKPGPFVIQRVVTSPPEGYSQAEVEVAVVKDHLQRLDDAVLGPGGVVAQMHTLSALCERLERKVDAQPGVADFARLQNNLSTQLYQGIEALRRDVLKLPKVLDGGVR